MLRQGEIFNFFAAIIEEPLTSRIENIWIMFCPNITPFITIILFSEAFCLLVDVGCAGVFAWTSVSTIEVKSE